MKNSYIRIFLILLTTSFFISCDQATSPPKKPLLKEPISAPSRELPAREIMKLERITSIHYIDYDSVVANGHSHSGFVADFEYFIDTSRVKMIQHYPGIPNFFNTTVYNLADNTAWNYYSGQLTHPQLPNLQLAFNMTIQACLGGWLKGPITFLGKEYIGDKLCNVLTDFSGLQEWVWVKYRIPIQRRVAGSYDNIYQISVVQKRNIEINVQFPDSIFEPPQ